MTTRRMRFAFRIAKVTNTHPEYVTLIAFPLQQWYHEHYIYIACYANSQFVSGDPQCDHSLQIPEHATTPVLRNGCVYRLKTEYQGMVQRGASHREHTVRNTVRRRLTTGIRSKKCVVRRFRVVRTSQRVLTQTQIVQYSLLHTQAIWYSLLLLGYKPVQHVTVLNTVGNCNTMVLYYTQ